MRGLRQLPVVPFPSRSRTTSSFSQWKYFSLFCICPGTSNEETPRNPVNRKAVLVFADPIGLDLARRGLPHLLRPLLNPYHAAERVGADVHLFTSGPASATAGITLHQQRGRTFGERLERATDEIAHLGYDKIALIGRDCPSLEAADLVRAFRELEANKLVLGPDHRGGCYLIALRAGERHLLRGIRWRRNTDCAQLQERVQDEVVLLRTKADIDSWRDLPVLARTAERWGGLVAFLLRITFSLGERATDLVAFAWRADRARHQMPPPGLCA